MKLVLAALIAAGGTSAWLDAKTPAAWNTGGAIPKAPPLSADLKPGGHCAGGIRPVETPEDRAVHAAGWLPYGPYQRYAGTSLVMAEADVDGMCRPAAFNVFVFVGGAFAGTLSPAPMASRTDGALEDVHLTGAQSFGAEFARYTPSDPLCCASSTTSVTYKIVRKNARAVVVPIGTTTAKN